MEELILEVKESQFPKCWKFASDFQGAWHVIQSRRQSKLQGERLEKSEITGGFLNSANKKYIPSVFKNIDVIFWTTFGFCSLNIKWKEHLCSGSCDIVGSSLCFWSQRVPQRCLMSDGLEREGKPSLSSSLPPSPKAASIFSFIYWNSK